MTGPAQRELPKTKYLRSLLTFWKTNWHKVPLGIAVGVLGGILTTLFAKDAVFRAAIVAKITRSGRNPWFDSAQPYESYAVLMSCAVLALVLVAAGRCLWRVAKSFFSGVTSGLTILWGLAFFATLDFARPVSATAILYALGLASAFSALSMSLYLIAEDSPHRQAQPIKLDLKLVSGTREDRRWTNRIADAPIENWDEDILNRSPFVQTIADAVLVSRAPVIAIHGAYGDGKTSILRLIQTSLKGRAILVPFSTWLPGSEDTLAMEIFESIAAECKRHYYAPQLRRRLLAYAKGLCNVVSYAKAVSELLPSTSQRDDIEELANILNRIPRRIVVLLDEMDRMEEKELRVLLKIIRGVSTFKNMTYICALNRLAVEALLPKVEGVRPHEYFEKFFPVIFELPRLDPALLFRLLSSQIKEILENAHCFRDKTEEKTFDDNLRELWDHTLASLCSNLRRVSLILNDVEFGIRPISTEVNPFDFVVLEIIRRFFPEVYSFIWNNEGFFAESTESWRETFDPEGTKKQRETKHKQLIEIVSSLSQGTEVQDLLWLLFPAYSRHYNPDRWGAKSKRPEADSDVAERERRIYHPDFFPVFFRYQVPETVFGESELNSFVGEVSQKNSREECEGYFAEVLKTMPRGSLKRQSFLHRLSAAVSRISSLQAESLAFALAANAKDYNYDMTWTVGEAGAALRTVFSVVGLFAKSPSVQHVLEQTILASTDDTFAVRVFLWASDPAKYKVSTDLSRLNIASLRSTFIHRMERRYNESMAAEADLSTADRDAFVLWVGDFETARQKEIAFWKKFIGNDRQRLAQAVAFLFPGNVVWSSGPAPFIDKLFPLDELRLLQEKLPQADKLHVSEQEALDRLRRLLAGEFASGYDPHGFLR